MGWSHTGTKTVLGRSQTMIQFSTVLTFLGRSWDDAMYTCKTVLGVAQRHSETVAQDRLVNVLQFRIILAPS